MVLKVVPVDPRSLFMGRYMTLSYDISRITLTPDWAAATRDLNPGDPVYIGLTRDRPARVSDVGSWLPTSDVPNQIYLKGIVQYKSSDVLQVAYGIERYYIPEKRTDEVAAIESRIAGGNKPVSTTVEIAVARDGRAMLRKVIVAGTPLDF